MPYLNRLATLFRTQCWPSALLILGCMACGVQETVDTGAKALDKFGNDLARSAANIDPAKIGMIFQAYVDARNKNESLVEAVRRAQALLDAELKSESAYIAVVGKIEAGFQCTIKVSGLKASDVRQQGIRQQGHGREPESWSFSTQEFAALGADPSLSIELLPPEDPAYYGYKDGGKWTSTVLVQRTCSCQKEEFSERSIRT